MCQIGALRSSYRCPTAERRSCLVVRPRIVRERRDKDYAKDVSRAARRCVTGRCTGVQGSGSLFVKNASARERQFTIINKAPTAPATVKVANFVISAS
jgi:hypothetical protein